jgi:ParB/RepB/Spo0J family partition protein
MLANIPLNRIDDNPFQARVQYSGIADLAKSILDLREARPETKGLINPPVGRLVNAQGEPLIVKPNKQDLIDFLSENQNVRIQIAAGHRRLRAFRYLAQEEQEWTYRTIPIDVQMLSDREMDDIAWSENADRENISPIEEARALQRAMNEFGYTQEEIGARRDLTQSAVSNKIRLLRLPEVAQDLINNGVITERHGRALLRLSEAFPPMQSQRTNLIYDLLTGSHHRTDDPSDVDPVAQVTKRVKAYLDEHTRNLSAAKFAGWQPPDGLPTCEGCEHRIKRGRRCKNPSCYDAKKNRHTALVTGPQKARALYREHSAAEGGRGWTVQPAPPRWARCACCKRSHNDLPQEYHHREWYKTENRYKYICPACWERANLTPIQPQDQNQPQEIASAAPIDADTTNQPESLDMPPPDTPEPEEPPATLVTARILPNDNARQERRVMVAVAEEGSFPSITRTGTLSDLTAIVDRAVDDYFQNMSREIPEEDATDE